VIKGVDIIESNSCKDHIHMLVLYHQK